LIDQPTDPPMEPLPDSTRWFESGPELLLRDQELAVLIVRIGMASNSLAGHSQAGANAAKSPAGQRMRDIVGALVTSAAFTNEAIRLAREEMKTLRRLAIGAGARPELLERVGQLCAGKHPSAQILNRARNQIGFHWDAAVIGLSVKEYGKNQKIIWLESDADSNPIHRLAVDVLAHALLGEATSQPDEAATQRAITSALSEVSAAMHLITEFFTACIYGYLKKSGAIRQTRESNQSDGSDPSE